jgi:hypothetical protein
MASGRPLFKTKTTLGLALLFPTIPVVLQILNLIYFFLLQIASRVLLIITTSACFAAAIASGKPLSY